MMWQAELTWFIGVFSILQILLLPGLLAIRSFDFTCGRLYQLLLVVGLSILINFWAVLVLTLLGFYLTVVVRSLVIIEVICLFWLYRHALGQLCQWQSIGEFMQSCYRGASEALQGSRWYRYTLFMIAWLVVALYVVNWLSAWGHIFGPWDPAVSWNPWALDWAHNMLPHFSYHYPQLMPANWSLSYVLIGHLNGPLDLQMFPHVVMGLFPVMVLLVLVALAKETRDFAFWPAIIITGFTLWWMMAVYFNLGYVDITAATLGLFATAALRMAIADQQSAVAHIWAGTLIVAACALTKQVGLYLVLVYPVVTYLTVTRADWPRRFALLLMLGQWVVLALLVAPWYGIAQWLITLGVNHSEVHYVTQVIFQGDSLREHLSIAWIKGGLWFEILIAASLILIWRIRFWRVIYALIALPLFIIWVIWFDYDNRNLAICIPLVSISVAFAWDYFTDHGRVQHGIVAAGRGAQKLRGWELVLMVFAVVLMLGFTSGLTAHDLNHHQIQLKRKLGNAHVDHVLYQYLHDHGLEGTIITTWPLLHDLPVLGDYAQRLSHHFYGQDMLPAVFQHVAILKAALVSYPQVRYLLVHDLQDMVSKPVQQYLNAQIADGHYKLLWHEKKFTFYKIETR